jgi:hypothetical protein
MVSAFRSKGDSMTRCCGAIVCLLAMASSSACQDGCHSSHGQGRANHAHKGVIKKVVHADYVEEVEIVTLGEVRVGNETLSFYVAYGHDSAILGFSASTGAGPVRYFPMYGSTDRGIPSVVLEVFASEAQDQIWVCSSWKDDHILAYHRVGSETAQTGWGELKFFDTPTPDSIGGGPLPFPALPKTAVKKATYNYQDEEL